MPPPKYGKKKTNKEELPKLLVALEFVKAAQEANSSKGEHYTHCRLANGYVMAFNGIIAIGHPIDEELMVCPHTFRLIEAIKRCKSAMSITQLDDTTLTIKAGRFRAVIPCLNLAALPYAQPDPHVRDADDDLKEGFALLNPLVTGAGKTTVEASILFRNNSMIATDRRIMMEYWHGIDVPGAISVPKVALNTIAKIPYKLVGIGGSMNTLTFHFEGGAWMRTQLYPEPWPDVDALLNKGDHYNAGPVPEIIYEAVEAVAPHCDTGAVYFKDGLVASHQADNVGATFEMEGVPSGLILAPDLIKKIEGKATKLDMVGHSGAVYFWGDKLRGLITKREA